jgi:hypothetical protein
MVGFALALAQLAGSGAEAQAPASRPGGNSLPPAGTSLARPGQVRIEAPEVVLAAPATETSLEIHISGREALPPSSFVRIRGLPPKVALSEGHVIAPGAWAVPYSALDGLRVIIPAGHAGKSDVSIAIVAVDGGILVETRAMLVVAPAAVAGRQPPPAGLEARTGGDDGEPSSSPAAPAMQPGKRLPQRLAAPIPAPDPPAAMPQPQPRGPVGGGAPSPQATEGRHAVPSGALQVPSAALAGAATVPAAPPPQQPRAGPPAAALPMAALPPVTAPRPPTTQPGAARPPGIPPNTGPSVDPEAHKQARSFLARGRTLLEAGNIALARPFLQRAADAGLAEGALAMGETYDANELGRRGTIGVQPDPAEARRWYVRARELGAGEAAERRLERLGAR